MSDEMLSASAAPIPQTVISPSPAPGLQGPRGLSPRQNYSRVNTGTPGDVDAGGRGQKSIMPKVGSVMSNQFSMATRPRALNDMLKTAMESALSRAKIAEEARHQLEKISSGSDEEGCRKCGKEKCSCAMGKTSSANSLPTDYILKLAAAGDFIVEQLSKEGADLAGSYTLTEGKVSPGTGPGALTVMETEPAGPAHVISGRTGEAKTNKQPTTPGLQKAQANEHGATQLENDMDRAPGTGDAATSGSTKNASAPVALLRKLASGGVTAPVGLIRAMAKQAEDAINPAQISAGSAVEPEVTVTGQPGPAASGKERVPESAKGVADYTRRDAKSVPKSEMHALLDEPMMSSAHDNVLQQAFSHTGEAGAKLSSADHQVKVAAARALLSNLVKGVK